MSRHESLLYLATHDHLAPQGALTDMCRRIKQFRLSCQGAGIDRLDRVLRLVAGGLRDGSLAQQIVEDDIRHNRLQRLRSPNPEQE